MSLYGNNMTFIEFQHRLFRYPVFSLQDVKKACGNFSYRQLDRWEKKGYLKKIKRGFYCFNDTPAHEDFLFYTANKIYTPSYVSLEMALRWYNFIPEEVFMVTSVGTKKTTDFTTCVGNFNYHHIKPELYWGYRLIKFGKQNILFAEPEKAVLDYLYLHPDLKTADDFLGMRINADEFLLLIDLEKFQTYLEAFHSKQLSRRVRILLTTIEHDKS